MTRLIPFQSPGREQGHCNFLAHLQREGRQVISTFNRSGAKQVIATSSVLLAIEASFRLSIAQARNRSLQRGERRGGATPLRHLSIAQARNRSLQLPGPGRSCQRPGFFQSLRREKRLCNAIATTRQHILSLFQSPGRETGHCNDRHPQARNQKCTFTLSIARPRNRSLQRLGCAGRQNSQAAFNRQAAKQIIAT